MTEQPLCRPYYDTMNPLRSSLFVAFGICAAVVVMGCRRNKAVTPSEPSAAPVAAVAPATVPLNAEPVSGKVVASTIESLDAAYTLETTETLNHFLGDYIKQHKRVPRDINEMVSLKVITSIPVLPGGRKWVINQQTGKISAQ